MLTREQFEEAIRDLSLKVATAQLEEAQERLAAAKSAREREELMTENVRKCLADSEKATELPAITVRTPTQEEIDN